MDTLTNTTSQRDIIETMNKEMVSLSQQVSSLIQEVSQLKSIVAFTPEWVTVGEVSIKNDISKQQLNRRVVESGVYTPTKQFKYINSDLYIHVSIVPELQRKRRHKGVA